MVNEALITKLVQLDKHANAPNTKSGCRIASYRSTRFFV